MANVKKKTYDDSYLFSLQLQEHHNHIADFIARSARIENKRADNFRGVVEDIKRYQKSAIIYHVLMRDDVVLCMNDVEMPGAFKVFMAKDSKANGLKKVFIDASGIIEVKNGSYICKNVQRLVTYLFEAITWLLYEYEPESLLNNSNITLAATDCFVKLFDYILGYFRFNGFAENRTKIDYLAALYFMINILGKDDDQYTHQVAAKLTKVDQSLTKSYSLYYDKEDLANIDSFITMLTDTFKFKDFNTSIFIDRWSQNIGRGTYYATELFTAFTNMMIAAYGGGLIVNQKTIDKQCGTSMVKLCENIMRLGSAELDRGKVFEQFINGNDEPVVRDKYINQLQEAAKAKASISPEAKYTKEDFKSKKLAANRAKAIIKYYKDSNQEAKIGSKLVAFAKAAIKAMDTTKRKDEYEIGVLTAIATAGKNYISGENTREIVNAITKASSEIRENIVKFRVDDKEFTKVLSAQLDELLKCQNIF